MDGFVRINPLVRESTSVSAAEEKVLGHTRL
jgi:hypothetical protein